MQLRLQTTVEGLSIAAISYYVVSLLVYGGKASRGGRAGQSGSGGRCADTAGVVGRVARNQRIHRKIHHGASGR